MLGEVDNPSPVGAMFKGIGFFLGPMFHLWINSELILITFLILNPFKVKASDEEMS